MARIICSEAKPFGGFSRDDKYLTTSMVEDWGQMTNFVIWDNEDSLIMT